MMEKDTMIVVKLKEEKTMLYAAFIYSNPDCITIYVITDSASSGVNAGKLSIPWNNVSYVSYLTEIEWDLALEEYFKVPTAKDLKDRGFMFSSTMENTKYDFN